MIGTLLAVALAAPSSFVALDDVDPTILQDMRYRTNYNFVAYPKLSGSWVVSEEPFFRHVPVINSFKLRSAWGRAGQQPDAFAAARTYAPTVGPGGVSTLTPQNLGNQDLKPEVGEELEAGFDASLVSLPSTVAPISMRSC